MDFAKTVLDRLSELNLNVNQAEQRANLPQGYIRGVVREDGKRAMPNIEKAARIADALGLELYLGPPRDVSVSAKSPAFDNDEYAKIPLRDATLAAGAGRHGSSERVLSELAFRKDWLASKHLSPANMALVRVAGDSMFPMIRDGDTVMINSEDVVIQVKKRSVGDQRASAIYALRDSTGARIKRVDRPRADLMILSSDNPMFPPEVYEGRQLQDIKIIGRVVWWGHTNWE